MAAGLEAYYTDNKSYPAWVCGGNGVCSNNWIVSQGLGSANSFSGTGTGAAKSHTFRIWAGDPRTDPNSQFRTLTTPIAYLNSYFMDPFASTRGASYSYYAQRNGWILYSFGPDTDENDQFAGDIDPYVEADLLPSYHSRFGATVYDSHIKQPTLLLIAMDGKTMTGLNFGPDAYAFTYDSTNGTASEGDLYRCK
ncbi:MAG: hypothetical protein NTX50_04185 [Candidatus Sumerlaeota bacterium]|nr:hypothetical protein [Candidatus Sumerlaeota bacterium]